MSKLRLITNNIATDELIDCSTEVSLHEDMLDLLFTYKDKIYNELVNIRGTYLIDHLAITVIDEKNKISIFSMTPSVEYNLIMQGLWKFDLSFSPKFQRQNSFYRWENGYCPNFLGEMKKIKEEKHGFTFGFNISKFENGICVVYSFATRSKNQGLYEYYKRHINELTALGDYGHKLVKNACHTFLNKRDKITNTGKNKSTSQRTYLKLIINNK